MRFTDGVVVDYTVRVTDRDGPFYVWARNLDRALELEAKTGDAREFDLRNDCDVARGRLNAQSVRRKTEARYSAPAPRAQRRREASSLVA